MIKEANENQILYLNTLTDYKITVNVFNNILIYLVDDEIAGFIDYSKMYERLEINYIFVVQKYRRKGIADSLIKYIMQNDFENITLEVNAFNESAIHLYRKNKFEIVSIRPNYYNGVDAYLMERRKL